VQPSAQYFALCRAAALRLPSRGRRSALGRRREVRAERPGVPAGQPGELRLREVYRQAASFRQPAVWPEAARGAVAARREVSASCHLRRAAASSFRQPAVCPEAARGAVAARPEVSASRHPQRAAALHRDAGQASSVLRRPEAFRREEQRSSVLGSRARQPEAVRGAVVARPEASALRHLRQEAAGLLLPPVVVSASCARAVCRSREAAAVGSDATAAQPWAVPAEPVASAQPPGVAREEVSAVVAELQRVVPAVEWGVAAEPQRVAEAAVWDVAEAPRQAAEGAAWGVAAEPQRVAEEAAWGVAEVPRRAAEAVGSGAEAEPQPVAASVLPAVSQPAAGPSAAPWAFRRDRALPGPVPRPAVRSAPAMRMSQAASRSERSWQAARCEGLS
jgi:hypothetical protein